MQRSRQRGQSIVEFGIIAILFTLLMFAIADFGLLLNDWLSVSSGARQLGREAAVGRFTCDPSACPGGPTQADIWNEANTLKIPGVSADPYFTNGYCCRAGTPGSALQVKVTYYDECAPGVDPVCNPVNTSDSSANGLDSRFFSNGTQGSCIYNPNPPANICLHPAPPGKTGTCPTTSVRACPGDTVVLTFTAAGAQVITPLVRPFFANPVTCAATSAHCYVSVGSTVIMRYEGDTLV